MMGSSAQPTAAYHNPTAEALSLARTKRTANHTAVTPKISEANNIRNNMTMSPRRRLIRSAIAPVRKPRNTIGRKRRMAIIATYNGDAVISNTTTPTARISNHRNVLSVAPTNQSDRNSRLWMSLYPPSVFL